MSPHCLHKSLVGGLSTIPTLVSYVNSFPVRKQRDGHLVHFFLLVTSSTLNLGSFMEEGGACVCYSKTEKSLSFKPIIDSWSDRQKFEYQLHYLLSGHRNDNLETDFLSIFHWRHNCQQDLVN